MRQAVLYPRFTLLGTRGPDALLLQTVIRHQVVQQSKLVKNLPAI